MHVRRVLVALTAAAVAVGLVTAPADAHQDGFLAPPNTVVLDGTRLELNRAGLLLGDPTLRTSFQDLITQADAALTTGPWSVMSKAMAPPSGDMHDYMSLAPYWWPTQPRTAEQPVGLPVHPEGRPA